MTGAREEILTRLRTALGREDGTTTRPGVVPSTGKPVDLDAEVPRAYLREGTLTRPAVIEQLVDRLVDYKAWVAEAPAADVPRIVAERLEQADSVVIPPGLEADVVSRLSDRVRITVDAAEAQEGAVADEEVESEAADRFASAEHRIHTIDELDATSAVITASRVSVAQTGTIMLDGDTDCGRRMITLVPDHHVCLVPESTVVEIVPEAVARIDLTRPVTMISGPSATSDIELQRVEGVHGPRQLDVIIITDR